jgi:hypothetical protein
MSVTSKTKAKIAAAVVFEPSLFLAQKNWQYRNLQYNGN